MRGYWLPWVGVLLGLGLGLPARAADTVVYYHTDALRSVAVVTNAQGQVIERTHYAPYGQVLNRPLREGPGYTGHREDPATGLVYMQQRYYDPESGRFLSTDPVQADASNGSNFNRYWYANDNPYRYTDPDGKESFLVSRPLGENSDSKFFVHDYVVANATRVGDPKASIFSYGKQNDGRTGPVDSKTRGASAGTSDRDAAHWRSLGGDAAKATQFSTKINADDSKVAKVATSIKTDKPYFVAPGITLNATNSNSMASAVADKAQGSKVALPAAGGRDALGARQRNRVDFKEH